MPEYPDVTVYVEALERRILGAVLERVRIVHPFLLRTVEPSVEEAQGQKVVTVHRIGKRIAVGVENGIYLVVHLMIAGRLRWERIGASVPRKLGLGAFDFVGATPGTLVLTEAGTKKRASLHIVRGPKALEGFDRGGLEVTDATIGQFAQAIRKENHTVKRTLTDPRLIAAVGNAYSDEILHRARLSPFKQTSSLNDSDIERLFQACREVLREWADRLRSETGDGFPGKVTAFHKAMAVHGKYNQPCPACGTPVQRIAYAENECNYCPTCQTGGKLLADRALSRLLKADWPGTLAELEELTNSIREKGEQA